MTILRQNILTIVPLFIVLGLLYALVSYLLQMKEYNWAMNEEAAGVGHTVNEFVSHNFDEYFNTNENDVTISQDLEIVLNRILEQDLTRSIYLFDEQNDTLFSAKSNKYPESQIADSISNEIDFETPENFEYRYALINSNANAILRIESLIHNPSDSSIVYVFQFDRDAGRYVDLKDHIHQWIIIEIILFFIIGLVVSLILSVIIKNRIQKLYRQSVEYISGNLNVNLDKGPITEFNDLGSTLDILVNVFNKNIDWYRKSIIQKEQLRTTAHLAANFKDRTRSPIHKKIGSMNILADYVGSESYNYILSERETDTNYSIFTGYVTGDDPIENSLMTDSIALLYKRSKSTADQFLVEINRQFQKYSLHCIILLIDKNSEIHQFELKDGKITQSDISISNLNEIVWTHFMGDDATEKIKFYTEQTPDLNQKALFADIQKLLDLVGSTTLISIQKVE